MQRSIILSWNLSFAGDEEARASFRGATAGLAAQRDRAQSERSCLVVDLGGRSTELVLGDQSSGAITAATSLAVGCLSLTAAAAPEEPGAAACLDQAVSFAADAIRADEHAAAAASAASDVIGVGGTITTAAALCLGLAEYDSGQVDNCTVSRAQLLQLAAEAGTPAGQQRCASLLWRMQMLKHL